MNSNVFVDGKWYGPDYPDAGDPPSDSIENRKVFEDDDPGVSAQGLTPVSEPSAPLIDPPQEYIIDPGSEADAPPPKTGPGSSRTRWLSYADDHGVRLRDDTAKDDIIAACETAGVRTE